MVEVLCFFKICFFKIYFFLAKYVIFSYYRPHTHKRFISRNWLMWLWGLASLEFAGQACQLEVQARAEAAVLRQSFFFCRKPQFLLWSPFRGLDEAHSTLQRKFSLLQVNWLKILATSMTHLHNRMAVGLPCVAKWAPWSSQTDLDN